jgi:hypothetical protein
MTGGTSATNQHCETKMKVKRYRTALLAVAAFVGSIAIAPAAEAQFSRIHPSFYGSAEWDTDETQFYLLGMYVGISKRGWSPYFNINAYHLRYDDFGVQNKLSAVSPTIGLAYAGRRSGFSFGGGYTWTDFDDPAAPGAEGGGSSGPHAALGAYHNGSGDRPLRTQFLSNYNFGAKYLWSRLRFSVPVADRLRAGVELIGQGGGENGSYSNTFKVGPTIEYQWTDNFRTGAVVGYKTYDRTGFADRRNAAYFKLEFSFSPF